MNDADASLLQSASADRSSCRDPATQTRIPAKALLTYGALAFPLSSAGLPIYLHAPDFYAVTLAQPLASLGLVLLALRLIDAVQDPLIGSLSDRFHARRPAILLAGTVMLGGGFWMLFHPIASAPLTWFAVSVLICTTGFSVVTINLQTLGGLWKTSPAERTRITGGREALGLLGLLAAAITPTLLTQWTGQTLAFHYLTLAYLPLLAGAFFLLMVWLKSARLSLPSTTSPPESWRTMLKDRWRATFFSLVLLNTFASAIPAVLVLFFVRDRLGAEALTGLFLLIYFLAGTASMPLWIRLAAGFGKVRAWQLSLGLAVVTFIWAALLGRGDLAAYAVVCGLSGLALGADLALPPALLADHIEADKRQGEASRLFSFMAFLSKSSLAAATGMALPILGLLGYAPGNEMTPQLDRVLSLAYAALPCTLKVAALIGLLMAENTLTSRFRTDQSSANDQTGSLR
ncbi:MFS transporter [Roseibium aggregatum]|uniref:MFS transporter n=1 Tax=Roseibium aggregatum TaxID=187304 RepID=UPI001AD8E46C|nr:MFS transporter [Roseibium aggregatum]